jgi:hypothetical protein
MRNCKYCQHLIENPAAAQKYCSNKCRTESLNGRNRLKPEHWMNRSQICKRCGAVFPLTKETGHNRKYCSDECSRKAMRQSIESFYAKNPGIMSRYNKRRYRKYGSDTLINRLRKKYPDLPTTCESIECHESRILEVAHKPSYKRNGTWRTITKCQRHMFWLLCPTCHRLIDRGYHSPSDLGLI